MKLRARLLDIKAGGRRIAILDEETASLVGVHSSDRVEITHKNKHLIAIVNLASDFQHNYVGVYQEVSAKLGIRNGEYVEVRPAERPEALNYVQAKIRGERLRKGQVKMIVEEVVERHLSDIEIASFVTALHIHGLSMDEIEALSKAMVETGNTLNLNETPVLDKHSIGGVPGDKTSLLIVPTIAAAGFIIPKTSSRAITSPAGTADRVEVFCPVDLTLEEIRKAVRKTNGCMVWGGALELAPADDIFIQVEYPLAIDPLLLPSIMSKKKAIDATHLVIDIPTGRGAKVKTISGANALAYDFIDLGQRLGIDVQCAVTYGEQPIGRAIGPALEAREALSTIMGNGPADLQEKATSIAGILFEMVGVENGKQTAEKLLKSGKAERKLRQMIEAQGGDPNVKPEDIKLGCKRAEITTEKDGRVLWISNKSLVQIAREAGAPKEKGAGVILKAKLGEQIGKGEPLFEIYAGRSTKLNSALELADRLQPIRLSKKPEERMLMKRVPTRIIQRKAFTPKRQSGRN
ncbi:MAG: AMP phosphorylase [Candidatus Bathyarchaeota archaeon]|nr:MAG: AMP phosphorylase [Candidatus Bathyarchaeota archaeon]